MLIFIVHGQPSVVVVVVVVDRAYLFAVGKVFM